MVLSEEESDDEDDTDELLRELEKIKRERAEEKARQENAQNAEDSAAREAQIASANPLLNLAAQLGQGNPNGVNTTAPGTFSVKRRWDDGEEIVLHVFLALTTLSDLIFKDQAMSSRDGKGGRFVNDLLRTEFHKCVPYL